MKTNLTSATARPSVPHDRVAQRAYAIWTARGRPLGCDHDHWMEAERQLVGAAPAEASLASRLPGWSDAFGTDIDRALDSLAPTYGVRSATSL